MSDHTPENKNLREYLLGITTENAEPIEERLLTDDDFFQEFLIEEEELIQDYVDGDLSEQESVKFESHFLISKERKEKLEFAESFRTHVNEAEVLTKTEKENSASKIETKKGFFQSIFSSPIPVAVCLLVIAGLSSYIVWNNFLKPSDNEIALTSLNKAFAKERPIESRISGFEYAPKRNTRGDEDSKVSKLALEIARDKIKKNAENNPNSENLHALGRYYLTIKEIDKAVEELEKAVKQHPISSIAHNDLGIAYMEKGRLKPESNLELYAKANEEFGKSIKIDRESKEAHFNKALVIELLGLPNQTKQAWEEYLKLDSSSEWAKEAKQKLAALKEKKTVSKSKDGVLEEFIEAKESNDKEKAWKLLSGNRELISQKLIPQQLVFLFIENSVNGNKVEAFGNLEALKFAGRLEAEKAKDFFWQKVGSYYENATNDEIQQLKLAKDHYLAGLKETSKNNKKALVELQLSQTLYKKQGNDLEPLIIKFWIAYSFDRLLKFKESQEEFEDLAQICKTKSFKWVGLLPNGWLASKAEVSKNFSESISLNKSTLKEASKISDLYHQQRISSQLAKIYFQTGQTKSALEALQKNLEIGKHPYASQSQRWRDYDSASGFFFGVKKYETALVFGKEALDLAGQKLNEKTFDYTALIKLGLIHGIKGDFDKAQVYFLESNKISEEFFDKATQKKAVAFRSLYSGMVKKKSKDYSIAIEDFDKAIGFYEENKALEVYSYNARKERLYCYLALGDENSYKREFPHILELFNTFRTKIIEEQNRNSFFNNEQDVYDIAIEYEFKKSNYSQAFDYSETSRSRTLLDLQNSLAKVSVDDGQPELKLSSKITEPLKFTQIQTEMPKNTQLLVYSVLQEKVLIWLVNKDSLETAKTEITLEKLDETINNYLEFITDSTDTSNQKKYSKELYKVLISPIKQKLSKDKQIIIIPDKVLFRLPFAALYSNNYLIEEYNISYSPSANIFLNSSRKAETFNGNKLESILSIGNPTFNQSEYENTLQLLPFAKTEVEEISKNYDKAIVLPDLSATKQKFKENLGTADIVHIAAHYLINDNSPLLSSLVLSGNKKEESDFTNYEILGEDFSNVRLIVLSACNTGIEKYYKGEGMIGASRTFLAKNIPLVVGSHWAVDSEATKELMVRFHQNRKNKKLSTTEALRQSQREMLSQDRYKEPYYWAPFATVGGYTEF